MPLQKNRYYVWLLLVYGALLLTACSALLKGDGGKTECACMYFDSRTGTIASECGAGNCGSEPITAVRASTQPSGNLDLATPLLDSVFAVPAYRFKLTLSADALQRIKTKGLTIRVYTKRADVWYSLQTYPAQLSGNSRIYLTGHY